MLTMTMTLMVVWESISLSNENLIILIFFHCIRFNTFLIDQKAPFLQLNTTFNMKAKNYPLGKNIPQMQFDRLRQISILQTSIGRVTSSKALDAKLLNILLEQENLNEFEIRIAPLAGNGLSQSSLGYC